MGRGMTFGRCSVSYTHLDVYKRQPYELACETGFLGSLELDEKPAGEAKARVKEAIAQKHSRQPTA